MNGRHVCRYGRLALAAAALAVVVSLQIAPSALANHVQPGFYPSQVNPSVQPRWGTPGPDSRAWESPVGCNGTEQMGTRNLLGFLNYHWPRGESWGIYNCRMNPPSLHAEGRAVDFHLDVLDPMDVAAADAISWYFRRPDSGGAGWAMARRFGLQEIIWNCRIWTSSRALDGWRLYDKCDPNSSKYTTDRTQQHKDHIHIGQNWKGARRQTTAWTGYHYCSTCSPTRTGGGGSTTNGGETGGDTGGTTPPPDTDTGAGDPTFPDPE